MLAALKTPKQQFYSAYTILYYYTMQPTCSVYHNLVITTVSYNPSFNTINCKVFFSYPQDPLQFASIALQIGET